MKYTINTTALLLIGFQNDYFAKDGILSGIIEESSKATEVLANTMYLIKHTQNMLILSLPFLFSNTYNQFNTQTGILKTIRDSGAFRKGEHGSETIPELKQFDSRIIEVFGKKSFNAFDNTPLDNLLQSYGIEKVILAGAFSSLCIDSTGRMAYDKGYSVIMLSDCILSGTAFEQQFYYEKIFPLYADVIDSKTMLKELVTPALLVA